MLGGNIARDQVWQELLKEVDVNGNGEINIKEFKTMMVKML
jgi:Ca2+-binding EF-hand superfamily protein